jgi:hypothetical protein
MPTLQLTFRALNLTILLSQATTSITASNQ